MAEESMIRYRDLWDRIASFANLWRAAREAWWGKRSRDTALAFHGDEGPELLRLSEDLRSRTYRPGPYRTFTRTVRRMGRPFAARCSE